MSTYATGPVGSAAAPPSTCPIAATFIARTSGLNSLHQEAVSTLICGLVNDGVWSKMDALYVYATVDSTTAFLNLVSSTYNSNSTVNPPAFTVDRGFSSPGGSGVSQLDTNFNPFVAISPNFVQNSAHISVWDVTDITEAVFAMGSTTTGPTWNVGIHTRFTDNNAYFYINSSTNTPAFAVATSIGHFIANRPSSATHEGYINGVSVTTGSSTSVAIPSGVSTIRVLGSINNGIASFGTRQIAAASIGGALTATDAANFYSRLRTYMTAVGVP